MQRVCGKEFLVRTNTQLLDQMYAVAIFLVWQTDTFFRIKFVFSYFAEERERESRQKCAFLENILIRMKDFN